MLKFQPKYYVVYSLFFFSNKDLNTYMVGQVTEKQGDGLYTGRFCSELEMGQTDVAFTT